MKPNLIQNDKFAFTSSFKPLIQHPKKMLEIPSKSEKSIFTMIP